MLNDKERADFDEYWQPIFAGHPVHIPFRVTVVDPDYFDVVFPLNISTDATTYQLFRLEFIFEKLPHDSLTTTMIPATLVVQRPSLSTKPVGSSNLLVVEWGGTILP